MKTLKNKILVTDNFSSDFLKKRALDKDIVCENCKWSWNKLDSEKNDLYVCHRCGYDNNAKTSNIDGNVKENNNNKIKPFVYVLSAVALSLLVLSLVKTIK